MYKRALENAALLHSSRHSLRNYYPLFTIHPIISAFSLTMDHFTDATLSSKDTFESIPTNYDQDGNDSGFTCTIA
jgi:hypothetical protein